MTYLHALLFAVVLTEAARADELRAAEPAQSSASADVTSSSLSKTDKSRSDRSKRVQPVTMNEPDDGYRGIWYYNQKLDNEYVYKYSGGLATYCANHAPFAVYSAAANKTFFCYGGTRSGSFRKLVHMVSYYDHTTGTVPRPTLLLDKETSDAHDNPVISVDDAGHIWIFSTSHGRARPSYIHRSKRPYDIAEFEQVNATYEQDGQQVPLDNFSYLQAWHVPGRGFLSFFTHYNDPAARTSMFMTSRDGRTWSSWQRLAAIEEGHYQNSVVRDGKAACVFNYHPRKLGLNHRTNLYYLETLNYGESWQNVAGERIEVPVTEKHNAGLVKDYENLGMKVYIIEVALDDAGRPVILYITTKGFEPGPKNGPRTWNIARWTGSEWRFSEVTQSGNNYDFGSLYLDDDTHWRIIGPTETGPQPYNPGGEMALWTSSDSGQSWSKQRQLTVGSSMNHTFARRPVNAHPDFQALWADGHGRQPSASRLYFANQAGDVFMLPEKMEEDFAKPILVLPNLEPVASEDPEEQAE